MRTPSLIAALIAVIAVPAVAWAAADPFLGTWKLDLSRSTFTPGPPPKTKILAFSETADGVVIDETETEPDGQVLTFKIPYARDGRPTPQNASRAYDMLSVTQPDTRTMDWKVMRKGEVIGWARATVSQDGRTLTMDSDIKPDASSSRSQHSVFDRQ